MRYTSAVIGLGNIGFGYDRDLCERKFILSHSRALSAHPDFELLAGVDPNPDLRKALSLVYDVDTFNTIDDLLAHYEPELIVNATPTSLHLKTVKTILSAYSPKAILCEKPLSYDFEEASELVNICNEANVKLYVNFLRRADPGILQLKRFIKTTALRFPFDAYVEYTKGLIHNGSHFADLFHFLFGPIQAYGEKIHDGQIVDKDGLVHTDFSFEHGRVIFNFVDHYCDERPVIKCSFSNGQMLYYRDGKIQLNYDTFISASATDMEKAKVIEGDMDHYQYNVLNQLAAALRDLENTLSTGHEALATQFWLNKAVGDLRFEE